MPLKSTLTNGSDGNLYVTYLLPQATNKKSIKNEVIGSWLRKTEVLVVLKSFSETFSAVFELYSFISLGVWSADKSYMVV